MSDTVAPGAALVQAISPDSIAGTLLALTNDAVVVLDAEGRCVGASRRALDLLGCTRAGIPRPDQILADDRNLESLKGAARARHANQASTSCLVLRHQDGHPVAVDATVSRSDGDGATYYIVAARETALTTAPANDLPAHFSIAVSHELRTPLTTILGSAEALLRAWPRLDGASRRQGLQRMLSAARRLDLLVRDLLLVTGIEEGDLAVKPVTVALAPLMEQAIYDASVTHPNLNIRARGLRDAPSIFADPDRVVQVLVYLLDNAARHGEGSGPPELRVDTRENGVIIRVSDRGPGLPIEGRERLFTRFGKLSQASHSGRIGTGLGLYLCRQLVERMGGAIGVDSTPGKGASFWFTLPLASQEVGSGR